ncbi:NACHT domain-containing protein [Kitasatospora cinereorecta]|uniref:NACHT domain-containing protein n=1 Tax=Kitasatospora cinereorecta TaxID=285560 RepID=A0ABW0VBR8_9ACTN
MSQVIRHPEGRYRPPSESRLVRGKRFRSRLRAYRLRTSRMWRVRREAGRRVPPAQRWRLRWTPATYLWTFSAIGALLFLGWIGLAVAVVLGSGGGVVDGACENKGSSCGVVISFATPFLALAMSTVVFLAVQHWKTIRPIRRIARSNPRDLVPTAGTIVDEVVGRQELCAVLAQALRDRRHRRPYLIVGGVGSGKTSVLVQLTQMLAEKGAMPVAVHLRRVDLDDEELNFSELAKRRFCDEVDPAVISRAQAERVWRQICMDDKAVVIADGLEEAFSDDEQQADRDGVIRRAIQRADKQRLPLVIASRPHTALEGTPAAVIDLEPLSEEAALGYLARSDPDADNRRLDWIVETAAVAESPLYLQIARQLRHHQLLEHLDGSRTWDQLDTRGGDRSRIRVSLLDSWRRALIGGHLQARFDIDSDQRRRTVAVISALACIGLLRDSLEVRFTELIDWKDGTPGGDPAPQVGRPAVLDALRQRVDGLPADGEEACWRTALSRYAAYGEQLGLVEAHSHKVRFPHSILQAFLGSDYLDAVQRRSDGVLRAALADPGRELLIALIMRSRRRTGGSRAGDRRSDGAAADGAGAADVGSVGVGSVGAGSVGVGSVDVGFRGAGFVAVRSEGLGLSDLRAETVGMLVDAAELRRDDKALDLFAAALEIDSGRAEDSAHPRIAAAILRHWPEIRDGDQRTLEDAKLRLVHRFGEAARRLDEACRNAEAERRAAPGYGELMRITWIEPGYPVRLAIAQEIGAGGDNAFDALRALFPWPQRRDGPEAERYDPWEQYKEAMADRQYEENCRRERRLGTPLEPVDPVGPAPDGERHGGTRVEIWREFVTRAWLVPMVVGSVGEERRGQARERMELWLRHLLPNPGTGRADLPISLEIALAQGFKSAANRRRRHPATSDEAREYLIERAEHMLTHARYWYSQLTLIHALCLWELPDHTEDEPLNGNDGHHPDIDPLRVVERWLTMAGSAQAPGDRPPEELRADEQHTAGGRRLHPFVAEGGDLAALALETRHPERYIWIDEKGATVNIGSSPADPTIHRKHNLWIPPSVGWSTLHPRAQQLLADVLLLLNLTERDGMRVDDRLQRSNRTVLPPCLTTDRSVLHPERTVGMPGLAEPGSACLRNCPFELCPYPAKGVRPGTELREPFCRQQQALLAGHRLRRRRAGWHGMTARELADFWGDMAERTRTPSVDGS